MARGRPRKIDPEIVLDKAMYVFWERGFEATSMNDISAETGMAKPGLYANFGDKEQLYCATLKHYNAKFGSQPARALMAGKGSLRGSLELFLKTTADFVLDSKQPGGCFVVNNNVECANSHPAITEINQDFDEQLRGVFIERFEKAKADGDLPQEADISRTVDFFIGQTVALGVLAKRGYDKKALYNLIEIALSTLPK
ncbi:TetR/AcrR family transcriptional regulator [Terasakiella sp. A23]|uniref:TetR/AcrR family transcriptional regulator n=1 Tax=Terasakiella sp. FCG-A23 TaxID=3080561 RepID=UPI002953595E|nr:TetR/AcrR family transcriptional regulator [Terasakiella sp. A23]MDV7340710.1 TetR/AcrR family transcriptional regulator [Terasakiella sp. A23]